MTQKGEQTTIYAVPCQCGLTEARSRITNKTIWLKSDGDTVSKYHVLNGNFPKGKPLSHHINKRIKINIVVGRPEEDLILGAEDTSLTS